MRLISRKSVVLLLFFVSLSSAAWSQGALPGSIDVAGALTVNGQTGLDGSKHIGLGLSGAYNRWGKLSALGEFEAQSLGSTLALRQSIEVVGAGPRYYFATKKRAALYLVGTGGLAHFNTNQVGLPKNSGQFGAYFGAGGGADIYVTEDIGIRPELRYQEAMVGQPSQFGAVQGSIGIYFRIGGEAKKKK